MKKLPRKRTGHAGSGHAKAQPTVKVSCFGFRNWFITPAVGSPNAKSGMRGPFPFKADALAAVVPEDNAPTTTEA